MSNVTKPAHYNSHPSGIECRVIARHHNFNIGNVIKYLWRAGLKNNTCEIEDLQKALDYLNDEINRLNLNIESKENINSIIKLQNEIKESKLKLAKFEFKEKTKHLSGIDAEDLPTLALKEQKRLLEQDFYYFSIGKYWFDGLWVNKEYIDSLDIKNLGDKHEHIIRLKNGLFYFGDLQPLYLDYLERMKSNEKDTAHN